MNLRSLLRPHSRLRLSGLALATGLLAAAGLYGAASTSAVAQTSVSSTPAVVPERLIIRLKTSSNDMRQTQNRSLAENDLNEQRTRLLGSVLNGAETLIHRRFMGDGAQVLDFDTKTANSRRLQVLEDLKKHPDVEFVEIDRRLRPQAAGPVTGVVNLLNSSSRNWFVKPASQEPASSNAATLWSRFHGDSRTVVAVVDTGILANHPSLLGRVLPGFDMVSDAFVANDNQALNSNSSRDADPSDPGSGLTLTDSLANPDCGGPTSSSWHGTFVAALIAGNPNQDAQVFPINWHGQILPVRALGRCGGFTSDLADAIRWAAGLPVPGTTPNTTPASVINLSLGASGPCSGNVEGRAINEAVSRGVVVVAAAGNQGGAIDTPANCSNTIAVGALDQEGLKASYSNFGSGITLMAPGGDSAFPMWSASNGGTQGPTGNTYAPKVGTSFATPLVASVISLMKSLNPALSGPDIVRILQETARPFIALQGSPVCSATTLSRECNCTREQCGAGMLDAAAAINAARPNQVLANLIGPGVVPPGETGQFDASASFNPAGGALNWRWELVSFAGSTPPIIVSPTLPVTNIRFPAGVQAARFQLTVSNGNQSHSILKNVVVAESGTAQPDLTAAVLALTTGTLTSAPAPVAGADTPAGPGNPGNASGSQSNGSNGSSVQAAGGGGGQLPVESILLLMTGLVLLRLTNRQRFPNTPIPALAGFQRKD